MLLMKNKVTIVAGWDNSVIFWVIMKLCSWYQERFLSWEILSSQEMISFHRKWFSFKWNVFFSQEITSFQRKCFLSRETISFYDKYFLHRKWYPFTGNFSFHMKWNDFLSQEMNSFHGKLFPLIRNDFLW